MASVLRSFANTNARLQPTVGDYKTNALETDHMGWLKCDGRALNVVDYPELYLVIGEAFGVSGETFFLPAPQGRVPGFVGRPQTDGVNDVSGTNHNLGVKTGEEFHLLLLSEIPAHNHDISGGALDVSNGVIPTANGRTDVSGAHTHTMEQTVSANDATGTTVQGGTGASVAPAGDHNHTLDISGNHSHQIASNGGSQVHNNIQPTIWIGNLFIYSGRPWIATPYARALVGSAPVPGSNKYPPEPSLHLY